AEAERAIAETQLVQAQAAVDIARATLIQFTGAPVAPRTISGTTAASTTDSVVSNPRALEQAAAIDEVKAREKVLDRSYYPRFNPQYRRAQAALSAARQIAQNTPIQLRAARAGEQQAMARYKSGLTSIVELAEAERLLAQAEIDDALARLNIWRAQLAVAAATG